MFICEHFNVNYSTDSIKSKATQKSKIYKKLTTSLKLEKDQKVDQLFHHAHEAVFEELDCLQCANCCKTTSPVFTERDIERIALHLKVRPVTFIGQYLMRDEESDWVLKQSPCAFLEPDNTCRIYSHRPVACKTYPHTNRKKVRQLMDLTLKNSLICPAVQLMLDSLEQNMSK